MVKLFEIILNLLQCFIFAIFIHSSLVAQKSLKKIRLAWLACVICYTSVVSLQFAILNDKFYLKLALFFLLNALCAIVLYKDSLPKKIFISLLASIILVVSKATSAKLVYNLLIPFIPIINKYNLQAVSIQAVSFLMQLLFLLLLLPYFRYVQKYEGESFSKLILLLPLSQCFFVVIWLLSIFTQKINLMMGWCLFAVVLFVIVDILAFKLSALAAKRQDAEQALKLQRKLFQLQLEDQKDMQGILNNIEKGKTDFNEFLNTLYNQVNTKGMEQALLSLQNISEKRAIKKDVISQNYGADAVLRKIINQCDENKIELVLQIDIPQDLVIKDIHICSLVTNILNNAMKASVELDEKSRKITFDMVCVQGQFVINCKNNYSKATPPKAGNGLGTEIINDITNFYQGIYQVRDTGYEYSVCVVLPLEERETVKC